MKQNKPKERDDEAPDGVGFDKQKTDPAQIKRDAGCWGFFKHYFLEGQAMMTPRTPGGTELELEVIDENSPWHVRYRKWIAILLPVIVVWGVWWPYMIVEDKWYLFTERADTQNPDDEGQFRYYMSITMVFGSMIAGSTSEGGASVAFPIMTLVLNVAPTVARDFSFMIQSVGMVAAAFTIWWMNVKVEWRSVSYTSLGGFLGIILGLEYVAPALDPPFKKMYFVVVWAAFAFSLYWLNRYHGRKTFRDIPKWEKGVLWSYPLGDSYTIAFNWKAFTLFLFGVAGGICSAIAGSGIDICSFSCLTLLFRVTEKTATPTSVVLMGINTAFGFFWRGVAQDDLEGSDAWGFLAVCAPIVVVGAPFGSMIGSHFHRLTLAAMVYITDSVQLIGALAVVKPWLHKKDGGKTDKPTLLCVSSAIIFIIGGIFFTWLARTGLNVMNTILEEMGEEAENESSSGKSDKQKRAEIEIATANTDAAGSKGQVI